MVEFLRDYGTIISALTGGLAGYVLNIIVTHMKRKRKVLGYSIITQSIAKSSRPDLKILWGERPLSSVDAVLLTLRNIGNQPLVHIPVRVETEAGSEILETADTGPLGVEVTPIHESENSHIFTIDLLNPGEVLSLALTVANAGGGLVQLSARAEFLQVREVKTAASTPELLDDLFKAGTPGTNFARFILRLLGQIG